MHSIKKWSRLLVAILVLPCVLSAAEQQRPESSYLPEKDGVILNLSPGKLKLQVISESIIRVVAAPGDSFPALKSLVVLDRPMPAAKWSIDQDQDQLVLATSKLSARVSLKTGAVSFHDANGALLLAEPQTSPRDFQPVKVQGENTHNAQQFFLFSPGEALYGLGQFQNGHINYRGRMLLLAQINTIVVNPFLVSTQGYGILWDNYSKTIFDDRKLQADGSSTGYFWSEVADGIDYYFIYGPELDEVISGYRELTGPAPMYPKWAYGYFQSKERYQSFDELIAVVKEYRRRQIPLDTIVQDWMYWGKLGWNPLKFDESGPFKDPAKRIQEIHELNAHIIISIWPNMTDKSEVYAELAAAGHLYQQAPLTMTLFDRSKIYDAYSPEAREIYWRHLKKNIFDQGLDGFWMDATEPETGRAALEVATDWMRAPSSNAATGRERGLSSAQKKADKVIKALKKNDLGSMARYLNTYPLMTTGGVYENWRKSNSDKRVYILTRSAFAGQQRNAATTWSGDIFGRWPVLRNQIAAGINFCMAGIPYWTTDIGGFFTEKNLLGRTRRCQDPAYRELYVRWFQFGAFSPIFRSHGTNTPREVWRFGEPGEDAYDALVKFDNLRYRLMPYIYSLGWMVTSGNYTIMRGLAMDFRTDAKVYNIADQFMFGPAFLVCPVTEPQKGRLDPGREVYLPAAAGWYDFWTGKKIEGGRNLRAAAPLSIMPLFVKAGSIIPLGPFIQYATQGQDPIELRIYPGADGRFVLYEDENDNYDYEKGVFATIEFKWNDSEKTLVIGERQGRFPGMMEKRTFHVVWVGEDRGAGVNPTRAPDKTIEYSGKAISIKR